MFLGLLNSNKTYLFTCFCSVITYKAKASSFFVVRAVGRIISGRSVGKILIIILSFKVGTSKTKDTDHRVKETCATMSIQVTYETDHISFQQCEMR